MFYGKGNLKSVLGSDEFIKSVLRKIEINRPYFNKFQDHLPAIAAIVAVVAPHMEA